MALITIDLVPYQDAARDPITTPKLTGETDIAYENRLNDAASKAAADALYYYNTNEKLPPIQKYPSNTTIPNSASTTTGTVIDKINNNLVHECGQSDFVRKAVELASGVARTIILGIREGIKAALKALGITPGFGGLSDIIKAIKNLVEDITYYINLVNDFVNNVVLVIAKIQALIAFILSLPAQLLKLFKDCLAAAYAEIKRNIFQAIDELGDIDDGGITSDVTALLDSTKKLTSATSELLQAPSKIIGATSPSSLTQAEKNSVLSGLFPGSSQYDSNSYSGRI